MDFLTKHWGDLASLLGFAFTIWFAWRASTAAELARKAAEEARDLTLRYDSGAIGGDYDYRRDHAAAADARPGRLFGILC